MDPGDGSRPAGPRWAGPELGADCCRPSMSVAEDVCAGPTWDPPHTLPHEGIGWVDVNTTAATAGRATRWDPTLRSPRRRRPATRLTEEGVGGG